MISVITLVTTEMETPKWTSFYRVSVERLTRFGPRVMAKDDADRVPVARKWRAFVR